MKRRLTYLFISIPLLLTSCIETHIIDEIMILGALGLDYINEKETRLIGNTPAFVENQPVENVLHENIMSTQKHSIEELQKNAIFEIKLGSLMATLFNREYAEKHGLYGFVNYLKREPYVGAKLYLAIVEGETKSIFEDDYGERGNGFFIENLIQHNIEKHDLPKNNLHLFLFNYFQKGKDPHLPIIKKTGPGELQIDGVALFKDDKMIERLPNEKLFFFKLLVDNYTEGTFRTHQDGSEINYEHVKSKLKMRLRERNPYVIDLNLDIKGALTDYTNGDLDEKTIKRAEVLLKKKIEKEVADLLKKLQQLNVDPAGIGAFVKSRTRGFNLVEWEKAYPETTFHVQAKVLIRDTGTIR